MAHKSYVTYIVWFNSLHGTIPYVVFIVVYSIKICNFTLGNGTYYNWKKTPEMVVL